MTDNEIIKALECCAEDRCSQCPLQDDVCSEKDVIKDALDLITRQKTEILRLKSMNQAKLDTIHDLQVEIEQWKEEANKYQNLWCMAVDDIEKAKSEAIKEFAEKLKKRIYKGGVHPTVEDEFMCDIDNLVKEMVGDDNVSAL